jgi:hypothetical protein
MMIIAERFMARVQNIIENFRLNQYPGFLMSPVLHIYPTSGKAGLTTK